MRQIHGYLLTPLILLFSVLVYAQDGKNPEFPPNKDSLYLIVDSVNNLFLPLKDDSPLSFRFTSLAGMQGNTLAGNTHRFIKIRKDQIDPNREALGMVSYPLYYRVRPKETLFRIARIYFDMSILQLMDLNSLDSTALSIDQDLLIGYLHLPAQNAGKQSQPAAGPGNHGGPAILRYHDEDSIVVNEFKPDKESRGVAYWDKQQDMSGALLVMHPTARINSLIEIMNPMFNRKVRAKVIGHIPEHRYPADISIIVSPEVAKQLGALDSRFHVIMRYEE